MKLITGIIVGLVIGFMSFSTYQEKWMLVENTVDSVMKDPEGTATNMIGKLKQKSEQNILPLLNDINNADNLVVTASDAVENKQDNLDVNNESELVQIKSETAVLAPNANELQLNKQVFWKPFLSNDKAHGFCRKIIELGVTCQIDKGQDSTHHVYFLYQNGMDRSQKIIQIEQGLAMELELAN